MGQNSFYFSTEIQPHTVRSQEILKKHPEVAKLIGQNPYTFLIILGLVGFQLGIAAFFGTLGTGYWWAAIIVAWVIGAFATNPLYVAVHEGTHNLVFKNKSLNRWCSIMADMANVVPGGIGFTIYHLKHHAYMGDDALDADLPSPIEARLVKNVTWRKALWMLGFPLWQIFRTFGMNKINTFTNWMFINIVAVFAVDALMVYFFGWNSLIYLFFSMLFALGLHPVGGRWIQEHYTINENQETYSYYGPLNKLCLNIGFHNEHHDFPSIPWNRLPQLKKLAPEYYDHLEAHKSWPGLLYDFITKPEYSLYCRVKR